MPRARRYQPVGDFLRRQRAGEVRLSFLEVERLAGTGLPASAWRHRAWWSNHPGNNPMTRVWLDAGFRTGQVDMQGRTLVFRREGEAQPSAGDPPAGSVGEPRRKRHPLFGVMQGLMRLAPGTDLAGPADPEWSGRRRRNRVRVSEPGEAG